MNHDIFISYSRKDKTVVEVLCSALDEAGISYWIDRKDILPGDSFPGEIANAIEHSKLLVFVSSGLSNQSDYVAREVFYALNHKIPVIPFKLDEEPYNKSMQLMLAMYNQFQAYPPPVEVYLSEFIQNLKNILKVSDTRPFLKRITDENDPDLSVLLDIYRHCFPADRNAAEEFIIRGLFVFTGKHQSYLFVLKTAIKVIGIADVSYFPEHSRLFVSYIGVYRYKTPGEQIIYTHNIIEGLLKYFAENNLPVDEILFETEEEKVFRYFARALKTRFGHTAYKLCFDYYQPAMASDTEAGVTTEQLSNLVYVPITKKRKLKTLPKKKVLKMIEFIYKRIYINITTRPEHEHFRYLDQLYQRYVNELPERVVLSE
jgi:hypothetical protein